MVSSTTVLAQRAAARPARVAALERLEVLAPRLMVITILLWIVAIFAASFYKYETFGQGYDQVDFEQAIWNTVQGRPMEDSRFNFTDSVFGMDWMPMLMLFVPAYALVPSAHTLFFLQIVGTALGAVPLYWLARDRLGSKIAGLGAGATYLLYPTLLHGVLNPFQVRLFSVTLLLFGFYHFQKGNWKLFAALALLAMLARSDVSLVVAMFGIYALLTRRRWPYIVGPLVVGLGYFALSTFVILPSFIHPDALHGPSGPLGSDYMSCWPCGHNPQLAYYGHLGSTGPEIAGYIVTHPVQVAQLMLRREKIEYMLSLLVPLLFLPLLAPRLLVLGLPILALNLLSLRSSQYNYQFQYSLLLIPGLFAAAIYGADNLAHLVVGRRSSVVRRRAVQAGALLLVAWSLVMTIPYKNPAARTFLFHETPQKIEAAQQIIAMVPQDAKVAASSKLAPHLLPRRYIYNFPPAPYSPYNFGPDRQSPKYVDLDYILVDPKASAIDFEENKIGGKTGLEVLHELPQWQLVVSKAGIELYQRH
jgi:uncharacterized membrane protein